MFLCPIESQSDFSLNKKKHILGKTICTLLVSQLKSARNAEANISYVIIITNLNLNIKIKVAIRPNNRDKIGINRWIGF